VFYAVTDINSFFVCKIGCSDFANEVDGGMEVVDVFMEAVSFFLKQNAEFLTAY
jgi:hypothetical protein